MMSEHINVNCVSIGVKFVAFHFKQGTSLLCLHLFSFLMNVATKNCTEFDYYKTRVIKTFLRRHVK